MCFENEDYVKISDEAGMPQTPLVTPAQLLRGSDKVLRCLSGFEI